MMKNKGIIPINKPKDWTSFDVVNKLKYKLKPLKVGHLGTLDPMATGVLLVTVGKATKLFDIMQQKRKTAIVSTIAGVSLFLGGAGIAGGVLLNELHNEKKDNFDTKMYIDMLEMDNFSQELTIDALQREIDKLTTTETVDSVKQKAELLQKYIDEKAVHTQEDRSYIHTQFEYLMDKIDALYSLGLATKEDHELVSSTLNTMNDKYIIRNITNATAKLDNYTNLELYLTVNQNGIKTESAQVFGQDKGYAYGVAADSNGEESYMIVSNSGETTLVIGDTLTPYEGTNTTEELKNNVYNSIVQEAELALEHAVEATYNSVEDTYTITGNEEEKNFSYTLVYDIDDNVLATYNQIIISDNNSGLFNGYVEFDDLDQATFDSQYANIESKIEAAKNKNQETGNEK